MCLQEELLAHILNLCLIFGGATILFSVAAILFYSLPPPPQQYTMVPISSPPHQHCFGYTNHMGINWYNCFLTVATLIPSFFSRPSPLWVLILPLHSLEDYYSKCGLCNSRINIIRELVRNEDLKSPLQIY